MMEGRVAVIAGATGGLGQVVAKRLAGGGARLALIGTDQERLDTLVGELGLPQDRVLTCVADLRGHKGAAANVLQVRAIDVKHERDRSAGSKNASWTTPEEIAAAIAYLCSDEAGSVNGARIPLYGGL